MCALNSRGMSVVCTWGLRGIFWCCALLCGRTLSYVCTVQFLILRILCWRSTNCVRMYFWPSAGTLFSRAKAKKKFWFHVTKKMKPKKRHEAQFTWSVKGKLFLFCIWIHMSYEYDDHLLVRAVQQQMPRRRRRQKWRQRQAMKQRRSLYIIYYLIARRPMSGLVQWQCIICSPLSSSSPPVME
jgi:hypothetical protein